VNPIAKLAGFAGVLVLVFGVALAAGSAIGPERQGTEAHGSEPDPVRGLAVADGGLTLALEPRHEGELAFQILDAEGRPVRDYDVEHEKRMHVIVVRRDGRGFQHVHPRLGDDGVWRAPLTLREAGSYRVFADFVHDGEAETLAADLAVDGDAAYRPLPAPATTARTADGYDVRLDAEGPRAGEEAELSFTVSRGGETLRTERYLGAGGHLVALREGDLAYLHVHPTEHGTAVSFMTEFPSEGRYRLYFQFKQAGRVHTAEFTQQVAR
jgi:hypothetical protein